MVYKKEPDSFTYNPDLVEILVQSVNILLASF